MPERSLLCVLPGERASLCDAVLATGAIPVVDLTCTKVGSVPDGAWVRVRSRRSVPGSGPVVLVGSHKSPVRNRETWLEVTVPKPAPAGFAGVVLRGNEVGGPCGSEAGLSLLAQIGRDQAVILDAGCTPDTAASAITAGASGIILSDVLFGLDELEIPAGLSERLDRLDASAFHVVNGFQIVASPLAPALRGLLAGEGFWDLASGWFDAADPSAVVWPAGPGLTAAVSLGQAYGSLAGLIAAYQSALKQGGGATVARPAVTPSLDPSAPPASSSDLIAIIGLGCRLPGALSVDEYWDNLINGRSAIGEVPVERWDSRLYWDPDKSVPDKTYAKIGGFLHDFEFNARKFRIPPNVAKQVAIVQQIALESVGEALDDAGYGKDRDFDRSRVGVILGNSMGGEVTDDYVMRSRFPAIAEALASVAEFADLPKGVRSTILENFEVQVKAPLPPINEDSMPGELSNVIAGRVANAFDLCGPNFTVDAACASSMAAIQAASKALQSGDVDMVVTGGADRSMGVPTYTKFCKIGALSPRHSAPFDAAADGFVMGEGAGILVLKRLQDARRDGDRVYAVIRGIGASSDGKGKGITAPNPRGQELALQRAYADAGIDPVEVDLIEAHGTSTVVGDKVEIESLTKVIGTGRRGTRGPVRLGSVKSNIGHLKSAAGAASCIKATLALHNKVFPPSINFETGRPDVPFDAVPLQVQTHVEPWPDGNIRRVGVSAFGFGGTNFHVVLEEYRPEPVAVSAVTVSAPTPEIGNVPLPAGVWGISAMDRSHLIRELEAGAKGGFDPSASVRLAAAGDAEAKAEQIERALKVLRKDGPIELLRGRGIYVEETPSDGKVAFLFTGQGSQYLDMGLDLAERYPVVQATFDEADAVMDSELGRPLSAFIRRDPDLPEQEQFEALRATEISQPATLTVDVAILRLLAAHGVYPDMVAGHSLGEYAAAVAAGIISFRDALVAVSARGREMAAVQIDDKGQMAGIATSVEKVQSVLAEIPGYVVPANKNCASQTVIAGASEAVEAAIEAFQSRGITVYPLPVSHAFHSRIVAPASAPLRKVLDRLDIRPPRRPITTNVTSRYYPDGEGAREEIIDTLAQQVASPVEWIAQIERMYADGARIFVECGPKRALTGFVASILKRRPHRAIYTNHPKRGGVESFHDSLAALSTLGFAINDAPDDAVTDLFVEPPPRLATSDQMRKWGPTAVEPSPLAASAHATPFVVRAVMEVVAEATGYSTTELNLEDELEADLGIDTVKQAEVVAVVRDRFRLDHDPSFRLSDYRTLRDLANYAARRLGATQPAALERVLGATQGVRPAARMSDEVVAGLPRGVLVALAEGAARAGLDHLEAEEFASTILPAVQGLVQSLVSAVPVREIPAPAPLPPSAPLLAPDPVPTRSDEVLPMSEVVCTGASIGLPGGTAVFAEDNVKRVLEGEVRIRELSTGIQDSFLAKKVVRVHKDAKTGQGTFQSVESREEVIRLAGVKAAFDLAEEYGVDPGWIRALDITTQLAFAAGVEALRDAGIPLVRTHHETRKGKKVATGWKLPESMRDTTGVIFASAFPGYDRFAQLLLSNGDDGEGNFDRRFLFQILSMGHSQFAQYIGARGPNAQANAACASTTQAVAMAADWIRLGRCERVVIVAADDVTNDNLIEWIGAGFLATGAATTSNVVEEAALPFDARRHGMILGMGAAGLIIERAADARGRGIAPLGRLLAARMANSAFHGTRLDPDHIAGEMDALVRDAVAAAGVDRATFAASAMFMSHETYTPAKGGSAAAEIQSLRVAFGEAASKVVVTNTKGFTGHPMGAGIEDTIVLKALQYGRVPPIPHLKEPDPDLGDLTLSPGGAIPLKYGIRLAAGFGSQLALLAWEGMADGDDRIVDQGLHAQWLKQISGLENPTLEVGQRHLRVVEGEASAKTSTPAPDRVPQVVPVPVPVESPAATASAASGGAVLDALLAVIGAKTGYGLDELDPEYELEADLGIDTVKQAEIFGQVRELYGLSPDDEFRLADYPTIEALAGWLEGQIAAKGGDTSAPIAAVEPEPAPVEAPPVPAPTSAVDASAVLDHLLATVSDKTGYAVDELDPEYELEADLGIDTVKQAEIFGQVRERYGLAPDEEFRLADYPTIEALAGWLAEQVAAAGGGPPVPAPVAEPAAPAVAPAAEPASASTGAVDASAVLDHLLATVSDKTGYAVDELDPEYELEADLGIDTVKQAEIFGQVRERYGLAPDEEFRLADYPTIEALAGWLTEQVAAKGEDGAQPAPAAEPEEAAPEPADEATPEPAVEAAPEPADEAAPEPALSLDLPDSFRIRRPILVSRPPWALGSIKGRVVRILGTGPLADAVQARVEERGASVAGEPDAVIDLGDSVMDDFDLAQALDGARPRDWICLTRVGPTPGTTADAQNAGARAGFAKAIGREWEDCGARVVDVDPSMDDVTAAALVCEELGAADGSIEIFWNADGRRVIELRVEPVPTQGVALEGQPVIVLTGGTRGITAEVAVAFAERGPCKLALLARTPPGETPLDEDAAKAEAKAALEAAGERATPAKVRERVKPLKRAEEARQNLARLVSLGAEVRFFQVDLADPDAVRATLDDVREAWGAIHGLVHGAGVEESRLIADKDATAFHRVFDGKAVGGVALADALQPDAWFVSMGSVAGRFGNPGQVDYCAANEAMARVCIARPRSLHVDWTAWADVGMAVRGGMDKLLGERGVEMLPAHAGSRLVADLVAAGSVGEIVVAGRLGDFGIAPSHPLIDKVEMDGDTIIARRSLSLGSDPWIVDHAIDGKPVLPGVIGLEMMVAVASLADPGHDYAGADDVSFMAPVKLHGEAPTEVIVRATPTADGVHCSLRSERAAKTGRILRTDHFEGTIRWTSTETLPDLPAMGLPDHSVSAESIYQRFFHGPAFQVLTGAAAVTSDALLADGSVQHASIAGGLLTVPLVLEAAFQAAGLHQMMVVGSMALPERIASVRLLGTARDGDAIRITVHRNNDSYDVDVDGSEGAILRLRGFQMVEAGPLPPGSRFDPPSGGWAAAMIARAQASSGEGPRASSILTEGERTVIAARGTDKRKADRTLGRIAAKRAISALTGRDPQSFRIVNADSGEPMVESNDGAPMPRVSISHREGEAVAAASSTGRMGIDLEVVEPHPASFAETWFRSSERQWAQGDARQESQVWAVKEAVLKALGMGMALDPREVEVLGIDDGQAEVQLWGEVRAHHASLGGGDLRITVEDDPTMVVVIAWMAS